MALVLTAIDGHGRLPCAAVRPRRHVSWGSLTGARSVRPRDYEPVSHEESAHAAVLAERIRDAVRAQLPRPGA
jgi:hypothetical protein